MRLRVLIAALIGIPLFVPTVAHAETFGFDAAVAVHGLKPIGDGIGDAYSAGIGAGAEIDMNVANLYRVAFSVQPTYGLGTPEAGPLATDPSGTLWEIPILGTIQIPLVRQSPLIPYLGVGGGMHYVRESISFTSGIGDRSETKSVTEFGWHVMAGIEQNRPARIFGELWYTHATTGGLKDAIDGRNLGGIQVRVGYRRGL